MYAHQVLEEMQTWDFKDQDLYAQAAHNVEQNIKKAVHFYLGDYWELEKPFEGLFKKHRLFFDGAEYLRLPYKHCWIAFDQAVRVKAPPDSINISKAGSLVSELEKDLLYIQPFMFCTTPPDIGWFMSSVGAYVAVGKPFREIPSFEEHVYERQPWLMEALKRMGHALRESCLETNILPAPLAVAAARMGPVNMLEEIRNEITAIAYFLMLLNCKNVSAEKILPPQKLNKKRKQKGKPEVFSYYVLNVEVPGQHSNEAASKGGLPGHHVRVHLCRGHFKLYTTEAPLFGKYTGLYWWQPHVRGQNKNGIVMKDYEIKPQGVA